MGQKKGAVGGKEGISERSWQSTGPKQGQWSMENLLEVPLQGLRVA